MVDSHAARLETSPLNHMRGRAKLHTDEAGVEYVPKSLTSVLEFDKVFLALRRSRSISVAATVRFLPFWPRKIRRTIFSGSNGCWEECGVFAAKLRGWI